MKVREETRVWQRPLKGNRVETRVSLHGHHLHLHSDVESTDALLAYFEQLTGSAVPAIARREPLYDRPRPPVVLPGQLNLDDAAQA